MQTRANITRRADEIGLTPRRRQISRRLSRMPGLHLHTKMRQAVDQVFVGADRETEASIEVDEIGLCVDFYGIGQRLGHFYSPLHQPAGKPAPTCALHRQHTAYRGGRTGRRRRNDAEIRQYFGAVGKE